MLRPTPRRRDLVALTLTVAALFGCAREQPPVRDVATPGAGRPAAAPDTGRDGGAFIAIYPAGPYEEVRVVRATDGALVVGGTCRFPDGTRITLTLLREGPNGPEPAATSRATVTLGRFMGGPLLPFGGAVLRGLHVIRMTVPFGPGDQTPEVLRAADEGRRFDGPGSGTVADGRIVHEITLEAPL